uniref:Uncharacterized protein n=1 Tax=Avena sativa TaxID=4498 RepID=A0ACD5UK65_AVESA
MGDPSCCCCELRCAGYPLLARRDPPLQRLVCSQGPPLARISACRYHRGLCLGHMSASLSKTSSDNKHQLVAFWAPFLLLHLGGQDTITAYALEDNELWLRHLLNMSLQVAGTGYVLHKYIIADRASIVSAAMLVSAAGFVKYGERIWALKCASKGSNGPNRPVLIPKYEPRDCFTRNKKFRTYAFMMMTAHNLRYVLVKPLIIDRNEASIVWSDDIIRLLTDHVEELLDFEAEDESARKKRHIEEVYRAIEVQLALTYDMLYTKAEVIHTWYGYLIRGISFVSCFGALVAFARSKRDGYCTPDIVITFVLLGGACALEVASAFKVIGSTWTYAILRGNRWNWLASAVLFARYHLIFVKDGRWSNSVGQYDFTSFCASGKTKLIKGRMAGWIGLEDWWNKSHYTKHAKISPALKEFVWGLLRGEESHMVRIEDVATRNGYWARKFRGFEQSEKLDWSLNLEFQHSVFIWHIATASFLRNPVIKSKLVEKGMAEAVNILSDYMMYLLVQHPDMLPMNVAARSLFQQTYACYPQDLNWYTKEDVDVGSLNAYTWPVLESMTLKNPYDDTNRVNLSKKYKNGAKPSFQEIQNKQDYYGLVRKICHDLTNSGWDAYPGEAVLVRANSLVRTLLDMELGLTHKLVIIGRVWTEMLCYAATNAYGDFHARQLSNGGEFVTHILLLTKYCSAMTPIVEACDRTTYDQPVEAAAHIKLNVHNDREEEITEFL